MKWKIRNWKKKKNEKTLDFLALQNVKKVYTSEVETYPTTCEEKLFFQETISNFSKWQVTKFWTLIFGITIDKMLN